MLSLSRLTAALVFVAASAGTAEAQRVARSGIHLGAAVNGSQVSYDEGDTDRGPGLSIYGGYNFTSSLGVVLAVTAASVTSDGDDSYMLRHLDLLGRYSFGGATLAPYVEAGYSNLNADGDTEDGDLVYKGSGITGGVGMNYFMKPKLGLDVSLRYTKGKFSSFELEGEEFSRGDLDVSTMRINIGFAYYL